MDSLIVIKLYRVLSEMLRLAKFYIKLCTTPQEYDDDLISSFRKYLQDLCNKTWPISGLHEYEYPTVSQHQSHLTFCLKKRWFSCHWNKMYSIACCITSCQHLFLLSVIGSIARMKGFSGSVFFSSWVWKLNVSIANSSSSTTRFMGSTQSIFVKNCTLIVNFCNTV